MTPKYGFAAAAILVAAAVFFSAPARAQPAPRPSPSFFRAGDCLDESCMRVRWLDFLRRQGESELPATGAAMRVIELDSEPDCPSNAPDPAGVHISRVEAGALYVSECGLRTRRDVPPVQMSRLTDGLDAPAVARLNGAFPTYCGEKETSAFVMEIAREGRYQIVEWDCDIPDAVKPIYGRILLLKGGRLQAH